MGDVGDDFRGHRADRQIKKRSNREQSAECLRNACIKFTSHNNGAHLIVEGPNTKIDFWPGTGLWHERGGKEGRGVKKLIFFIEDNKNV